MSTDKIRFCAWRTVENSPLINIKIPSLCISHFEFAIILVPCFIDELAYTYLNKHTVMFLSFQTDRSGQTVQTQIRLLL